MTSKKRIAVCQRKSLRTITGKVERMANQWVGLDTRTHTQLAQLLATLQRCDLHLEETIQSVDNERTAREAHLMAEIHTLRNRLKSMQGFHSSQHPEQQSSPPEKFE